MIHGNSIKMVLQLDIDDAVIGIGKAFISLLVGDQKTDTLGHGHLLTREV